MARPRSKLTSRQAEAYRLCEYVNVLAAAKREGWFLALMDAHGTPCRRDQVEPIIAWVLKRWPWHRGGCPSFRWGFGSARGHAYHSKAGYRIALPPSKDGKGRLRVGIVLHEIAHLIDHRRVRKFSHDAGFRAALRSLVESDWRSVVKDVSQAEIYARHRGPYSLLLTREGPKKVAATDRHPGPFSAEDAHERSRKLVEDPNDTITAVHVFSDNEGQFIGAFYKRGETYLPWAEIRAAELDALDHTAAEPREEPDAERAVDTERLEHEEGNPPDPAAASLQRGEEPVQEVESGTERPVQPRATPKPRPVRAVSEPRAAGAGKRSSRIELNPDKATEAWPKGEGARIVREAITASGPVTTKELIERTTPALTAAGVGFPASLISRLKQAGLLREVQE